MEMTKKKKWTSFIICTLHDLHIKGLIESRGIMREIRRICGEIFAQFSLENLDKRSYIGDLGRDQTIMLKSSIFNKCGTRT
jgi:hypothetical protein